MGATKRNVDFSDVKDRGAFNPKLVPDGDYLAKIIKVEDAEVQSGDNKGEFQYLFTIKLEKFSQYSYPYRCMLSANQLWKLRNVMVAAGFNVPKKKMALDPNKAVGKLVGVTMEEGEPYQGKTKSEIAAIFPAAELAEGAEVADDGEFDEGSDADTPEPEIDYSDADEPAAEKPKKDKGKKKKADKDVEEIDITDIG
jgi:hypothetical protein